ncbi:hypothetical protein TNIN_93221 [Trichonephila inaurata madagascariensis]|uniref:Uncharacterized protein n=1 Tax=Trichonephila inaurata madagascariensis TaxID=2747483 RepID=A0A8X6X6R5_9ARAC|nr:hypothetical protein TNIN_93221 [Trichonephila inaurata madagascariensis]
MNCNSTSVGGELVKRDLCKNLPRDGGIPLIGLFSGIATAISQIRPSNICGAFGKGIHYTRTEPLFAIEMLVWGVSRSPKAICWLHRVDRPLSKHGVGYQWRLNCD